MNNTTLRDGDKLFKQHDDRQLVTNNLVKSVDCTLEKSNIINSNPPPTPPPPGGGKIERIVLITKIKKLWYNICIG